MEPVQDWLTEPEETTVSALEMEAAGQVVFNFCAPLAPDPLPDEEPPVVGQFAYLV